MESASEALAANIVNIVNVVLRIIILFGDWKKANV